MCVFFLYLRYVVVCVVVGCYVAFGCLLVMVLVVWVLLLVVLVGVVVLVLSLLLVLLFSYLSSS